MYSPVSGSRVRVELEVMLLEVKLAMLNPTGSVIIGVSVGSGVGSVIRVSIGTSVVVRGDDVSDAWEG